MSKGKIIEVNLRYCDNILVFLYNVKSIDEYRKTKEYLIFKNRFGDQLRENILIDDNKDYTQPDASIFLSITQTEPTIEDFDMFLNNCLWLFDIHSLYAKSIHDHILSSYPKSKKNLMFHNIAIINNFEKGEQYILFDYMTVSKKQNIEYNFMRHK